MRPGLCGWGRSPSVALPCPFCSSPSLKIYFNYYYFWFVLGLCCAPGALRCCVRVSTAVKARLFMVVHGRLIAVVSLIVKHGT